MACWKNRLKSSTAGRQNKSSVARRGPGWTLRTLSEALKNLDFNLRARGKSLVDHNTFQNRGFLGTNRPNCAWKTSSGRLGGAVFLVASTRSVRRLRPPLEAVLWPEGLLGTRLCSPHPSPHCP